MKRIYILIVIINCCVSLKIQATDYYLRSGQNITNPASWGTNLDGTGTLATTFTVAGDVWHIRNANTGIQNSTNAFNPPATSTLVVENSRTFGIQNSAILDAVINVSANSILNIAMTNTFNIGSLAASSTVIFGSAGTGTANITQSRTYENVVIASNVTLTASGVVINGSLTINSTRTLRLNSRDLEIRGAIAGTGTFIGDAGAALTLETGNGGNNGTLRFASGGEILNTLNIQHSSITNTVVLGNNLTISNGFFTIVNGTFDMRARTLTIDNTSQISFPFSSSDGVIMADATTVLNLFGQIGFFGFNEIFMHPTHNTFRAINVDAAGQDLIIGTTLNITDSLSVRDGVVDANGLLTLRSTNSLKGRIGMVGPTGFIFNDMNVETFISGGATGWMNMGVAGVENQNFKTWDTWCSNTVSCPYGIPMTCVGCTYPPQGDFLRSW